MVPALVFIRIQQFWGEEKESRRGEAGTRLCLKSKTPVERGINLQSTGYMNKPFS